MPILNSWIELYRQLQQHPRLKYCQIFENKGKLVPLTMLMPKDLQWDVRIHTHSRHQKGTLANLCSGQCWALDTIPEEPAKEIRKLQQYHTKFGGCMLCDYAQMESEQGDRIIIENDHFIALCPYWAVWPYETIILSKTHAPSLLKLNGAQLTSLAEILSHITIKYDNLFEVSFPYSMGLHQAPLHGSESEINVCCLHVHFYPPLLRSATVKKFMVG